MSDVVIVGLLSVTGSVIASLIGAQSSKRETNATLAAHEQKQQDAIDSIKSELGEMKKRLDSHNGYAEKFASASKDIALTQKDVEYIKDQLKDILKICEVK